VAGHRERPPSLDSIYDAGYADRIEQSAASSAGTIAQSIAVDLRPRTIIDVGCGTGALLQRLSERGIVTLGLEYAEAALEYCRARNLSVSKFDLERDVPIDSWRSDVAVSMEVAEHLPATAADRYLDLLTKVASTVVFSAATPGQGGTGHINEQPHEYWISRFMSREFQVDVELTARWRTEWEAGGVVAPWYHRNVLLMRHRQC
jgi:cyclopropane fatty-acyl-phospholipid synthase-like methyltransferase